MNLSVGGKMSDKYYWRGTSAKKIPIKNHKFCLNLFGDLVEQQPKSNDELKRTKRNWENRFQHWCNKQSQDECTNLGVCGFGEMCDYCKDNSYGRPCVRALNQMLKERNLTIDYEKADFYSIWCGGYWKINKMKAMIVGCVP